MNIKTTLHAIAIVFAAMSASAHAQSELADAGPSTLNREEVKADAAAWRQAKLAELSRSETPNIDSAEYRSRVQDYLALRAKTVSTQAQLAAPVPSALTREEVKADAAAWRKAGLAELSSAETPNLDNREYQSRLQRYLASRA